jgi:MoaA/NifB/PqqE/SkfB family radical SAM enzyme
MLCAGLRGSALADARAEGYSVLSVSGGEPLLYDGLLELLGTAKALGMSTTVTTNGMLLNEERLAELIPSLDLLAISLDGKPEAHNRMRNHPRAFEVMGSRLPELRASGLPFGFIFTLTQYNMGELDWVAKFALEQGASLLQIHPLESVGRALDGLLEERPDGTEASFAFLEAARIQAMAGEQMKVQVDVTHRPSISINPEQVYASECQDLASLPLAELLSPLVIEADGAVVPLQYGFARAYALGNLHQATLAAMIPYWRDQRLAGFRRLCRAVHQESMEEKPELGEKMPFFNWYERIRSASCRMDSA